MYLPYKLRKLPLQFDAEQLRDELASVPEEWWIAQTFHNTGHDVLPLLSQHGTLRNRDETPNHSLLPPFEPTPYLEKLPRIRAVLAALGAPPSRTRLARLGPGTEVKPHVDINPHWYDKARLHVPIVTNPKAILHMWSEHGTFREADHVSVHMAPGEAWIFNQWYFHGVKNAGDEPRIHLTVDLPFVGAFREMALEGCSAVERADVERFTPPVYRIDSETLQWITGGRPEVASEYWNLEVRDDGTALQEHEFPPGC